MNNNNISLRLIVMNFLQFAAWGAYLTSMGRFLGISGFGPKIWLFYATQGFVSIFMPAIMGIVSDKWIPAQKVLSFSHFISGASICIAGLYAMFAGADMQFGIFYAIYTISVAFYMPTLAISNSVAYNSLESCGKDPVASYPPIRVFGTVGFIISMLCVNYIKDGNGIAFQQTYNQFILSGAISIILGVYALSLPACPLKPKTESSNFLDVTGLSAFKLFKQRKFAVFFIFSMLLGAALQITNGYANLFIFSFKRNPLYADTWAANNANALISLSQISETLCILLIPFFMKKFGIKRVMLIAMFAWVLRFGFFAIGNPGGGVWLFVLSCIVYGMAFDFFNISGSLFVNENAPKEIRSSAQGLFVLMTNGLGAAVGTWAAGLVVNHFVFNAETQSWSSAWLVFAAYSLVVAIAFMILFKDPNKEKIGKIY